MKISDVFLEMPWGSWNHRSDGDRGVPRGLLWDRSLGRAVLVGLVFGHLPHSLLRRWRKPTIHLETARERF